MTDDDMERAAGKAINERNAAVALLWEAERWMRHDPRCVHHAPASIECDCGYRAAHAQVTAFLADVAR